MPLAELDRRALDRYCTLRASAPDGTLDVRATFLGKKVSLERSLSLSVFHRVSPICGNDRFVCWKEPQGDGANTLESALSRDRASTLSSTSPSPTITRHFQKVCRWGGCRRAYAYLLEELEYVDAAEGLPWYLAPPPESDARRQPRFGIPLGFESVVVDESRGA